MKSYLYVLISLLLMSLSLATIQAQTPENITSNIRFGEIQSSTLPLADASTITETWALEDFAQGDIPLIRVVRISGQLNPRLRLYNGAGTVMLESTGNEFGDSDELIFEDGLNLEDAPFYIDVIVENIVDRFDYRAEYSLMLIKDGTRRARPDEGLERRLPDTGINEAPALLTTEQQIVGGLNIPVFGQEAVFENNILRAGGHELRIDTPVSLSAGVRNISFLDTGIALGIQNANLLVNPDRRFVSDENFTATFNDGTREYSFMMDSGMHIVTPFAQIDSIEVREGLAVFRITINGQAKRLIFDNQLIDVRRSGGEAINYTIRMDGSTITSNLALWDTLVSYRAEGDNQAGQVQLFAGDSSRFISEITSMSISGDENSTEQTITFNASQFNSDNTAPVTLNIDWHGIREIYVNNDIIRADIRSNDELIEEFIDNTASVLIRDAAVRFTRRDNTLRTVYPDGTNISTPDVLIENSDILPYEPGFRTRNYNNLGADILSTCPCSQEIQAHIPVNPANGNFFYSVEDFSTRGRSLALNLSRYYNSHDNRLTPGESRLIPRYLLNAPGIYPRSGNGWRHSYQYELNITTAPLNRITFIEPDGTGHYFRPVANGTQWTSDSLLSMVIFQAGGELGTWRAESTDGTHYYFDRAGRLSRITQGSQSILVTPAPDFYTTDDGSGVFYVDAYGRRIELYTNTEGRIVRAVHVDRSEVTYSYDDIGGLRTVDYGNLAPGNSSSYDYAEDGLLTGFNDVRSPYTRIGAIQYDPNRRVEKYTENPNSGDDLQREYTFLYPALNADNETRTTNRIFEVSGNRRVQSWTYDEDWLLIHVTLPVDDWIYEFGYDIRNTDSRAGILQTVRVPTGGTFRLTFDDWGNLTRFEDPLRESNYVFTYERRGARSLLTGIRYPNTRTETFTWSDEDVPMLLAQETLVEVGMERITRQTRFRYDDNGRLRMVIEPGNIATVYDYDIAGYVSRLSEDIQLQADEVDNTDVSIDPERATAIHSFTHDLTGQLIAMSNQRNGASYTLGWTNGQITSITAPDSNRISYSYTPRGLISSINDRGQQTFYSYNGLDLMTTIDAPDGIRSFSYDEAGNLLGIINNRNIVTNVYAYDELDNLSLHRTATGLLTSYTTTLDTSDNEIIRTELDASGRLVTRRYNYAGRLSRYTISSELEDYFQEFSLNYTSGGNLVSIEDTQIGGRTFSLDYNLAGDVRSIDVNGAITGFDYNNRGLLSRVTSPAGRVTQYEYDTAGNISLVTLPDGAEWQYQYDSANNLTSVTDPIGATTIYVPDVVNRLERIIYPEGHSEGFTYDGRGNLASISDARGNTTTFIYDVLDKLLSVTEDGENPRITEYTYDNIGRLDEINQSGASQPVQLTYDNDDNIIAINEQRERTLYSYDARGQVASITDQAGHTTSYEYNPVGLVTRIQDALGNIEAYSWRPGTNFLGAYTSPSGQRYAIDTDRSGRVTGIRLISNTGDTEAIDTQIVYDADGYIESIQLGTLNARNSGIDDRFYQFDYSFNGYPERYIDPSGQVWLLEYDSTGRLTLLTNPDGIRTRFDYEGLNLRVTNYLETEVEFTELFEFDANGNVIRYEVPGVIRNQYVYNSDDLPVEAHLALNEEDIPLLSYRFAYNAFGRLIMVTEPGGRQINYVYPRDAPDNLEIFNIIGTDGTQLRHTYGYDPVGNLSRVTLPGNSDGINLTYDALNRRVRYVDSVDNSWAYSYDAAGNLAQISDPIGSAVSYLYDEYNRVARITYPSSKIVDLEYDSAGNLDAVILPENVNGSRQRIEYELDEMGRVESVQVGRNFLGFGYDATGNIIRRFAPDGTISNYEYDEAGRLTRTTYNNSDETLTYAYDATGNLESVGDLQFTYDAAGRMTEASDTISTLQYQYDEAGNLVNRIATGALSGTTTYLYDSLYRVQQIDYAGHQITITYDAGGRISRIERGELQTVFGYDGNNRVQLISHSNSRGESEVRLFSYDNVGNLVNIEISLTRSDGVTETTRDTEVSYSYDIDQRLISERWLSEGDETSYVVNYLYDAVGNRIEENRNGRITTYTYNGQNQLIREERNLSADGSEFLFLPSVMFGIFGIVLLKRRRRLWIFVPVISGLFAGVVFAQSSAGVAVEYDYDANGNVRQIRYSREENYTLNYDYDRENRLISVEGQIIAFNEDGDESGNAINTTYTYDALSRVRTITTLDATYDLFYDGHTLIAMRDGDSIERYLSLNGETLLTITGDGETLWNLNDRQGSTRRYALTDGSFVDAPSRILEFGSFGNRIFPGVDRIVPIGATINRPVQFFGGQLYDPSTRLYLMGLRAYDPLTGRFLQPDPIRQDPVGTLYTYARNRPLVFQDPTGMFVEPFTAPFSSPALNQEIRPETLIPQADSAGIPVPPSVHHLQADETFRALQLLKATRSGVNETVLQVSPFLNELYLFDINPVSPEIQPFIAESLETMMAIYENGDGWIPDPRPDPAVSQNPFDALDEMMPLIARAYATALAFQEGNELELSLVPEVTLPQAFSEREIIEAELTQGLQPVQTILAFETESDYLIDIVPPDVAPVVSIPTVDLPVTLIEPPVLDALDDLREQTFDFYSRIRAIGTADCEDCVPPPGFNQ